MHFTIHRFGLSPMSEPNYVVLLIGSPQLVKSTIHYLHLVNYAEVGDWSRFLASPNNPEEVMSMLVRYLKVEQ